MSYYDLGFEQMLEASFVEEEKREKVRLQEVISNVRKRTSLEPLSTK